MTDTGTKFITFAGVVTVDTTAQWCVSSMLECPYCSSDLDRRGSYQTTRSTGTLGRKSTGSELVSCPDCDNVIDGFSAH